jgi:hypothetical protein
MYHYSITGSNLQCHLYPEKEASQLGVGHMRIIFRTQLGCHGVMKLHFQVRPPLSPLPSSQLSSSCPNLL